MIENYIATYKYAVFTTKTERQKMKIIKKMLLNDTAVFSIDTSPCLYMGIEGKLASLPFEVNYKYGHMKASFDLDDVFFTSLPEFFQVYIINSIGTTIFERNLTPTNIENDYIVLFLAPVILHFHETRIFTYPTIKIYRSGIIIVDLSVYSSGEELEEEKLVDFLIDIRTSGFDKIQMSKSILDSKKIVSEEDENILSDGISRLFGKYDGDEINSMKDLAIFLVADIVDESKTFIAHHNYAIDSEKISNKCLQSLMNGLKFEAVKEFKKENYTNYREFKNSHKHYVSVSTTITVGDITDTRIPSLVIDEMFLYMATKVYQLSNVINSGKNSIEDIINLYNVVINIKGYLLNGLSAYSFSKRIFDDLFRDYRLYEQIDNIKELIEVEIKKLEIRNTRRETSSQNWIAVVLALLSSEALVTYVIRPIYLEYTELKVEQLTMFENMFMFLLPLLVVITFMILRRIFRRKY